LYANDLQHTDFVLQYELRFMLYGGGPSGGVAVRWRRGQADDCDFFTYHYSFGADIGYTKIPDGSLFYDSDSSYNRLYVGDATDLVVHPDSDCYFPVEFDLEDFLTLWDEDGQKQEQLLQEKLDEWIEMDVDSDGERY
jgi:hypothetical protein